MVFTVNKVFIAAASHRGAVCQQDVILAAATHLHTTNCRLEKCCGGGTADAGDEEGGGDAAFCTRGYFIQNNDSG